MNKTVSPQPISCGEAVRGLTVDRVIARLRAVKADGIRIVNLRCVTAVSVGCEDVAMLLCGGVDRENRVSSGR